MPMSKDNLTCVMDHLQFPNLTENLDDEQCPDNIVGGRSTTTVANHEGFILFHLKEMLGDAPCVAAGNDADAGARTDGHKRLVEDILDVVFVGGGEVIRLVWVGLCVTYLRAFGGGAYTNHDLS